MIEVVEEEAGFDSFGGVSEGGSDDDRFFGAEGEGGIDFGIEGPFFDSAGHGEDSGAGLVGGGLVDFSPVGEAGGWVLKLGGDGPLGEGGEAGLGPLGEGEGIPPINADDGAVGGDGAAIPGFFFDGGGPEVGPVVGFVRGFGCRLVGVGEFGEVGELEEGVVLGDGDFGAVNFEGFGDFDGLFGGEWVITGRDFDEGFIFGSFFGGGWFGGIGGHDHEGDHGDDEGETTEESPE